VDQPAFRLASMRSHFPIFERPGIPRKASPCNPLIDRVRVGRQTWQDHW
jgi:hypothetical protein